MKPGAKSPASIFGPRFASCQLPAAPLPTACNAAAGSRPEAFAKFIASLAARLVTLTRIWLTSFVSCPLPERPMWVIVLP